jgi:transposase
MESNVVEPYHCGIDVSKAHLDIHVLEESVAWRVDNTPVGHEQLVAELMRRTKGNLKILLEATGGLERPLVAALAAAGFVVIVINPRQVRRFAQALSANPAKTDRADAQLLAQMCHTVPLQVRPLPSQQQRELSEIMARRRQLVEMLGREKTRLGQAVADRVRKDISETVQWIEERLQNLDEDMDKCLEKVEELTQIQEILKEENGVGDVTARIITVCLPELGRVDHKQIASLVGLAPIAMDSGKSSGARHICGGRADIRAALWMAAFNARQHNEKIRAYYNRLMSKGKHYKVAMVACMHKLLKILNAKVRNYLQSQTLPGTPPKSHYSARPC